jgi:hypothetical protein
LPSRPPPSNSQRDHRPMTLNLVFTILAVIAVAVFVLDAITPPRR